MKVRRGVSYRGPTVVVVEKKEQGKTENGVSEYLWEIKRLFKSRPLEIGYDWTLYR